MARNKEMENKLTRQMESVLKENRKKEVELKRMKVEKKQRDLVLKRKQEEVFPIFPIISKVSWFSQFYFQDLRRFPEVL